MNHEILYFQNIFDLDFPVCFFQSFFSYSEHQELEAVDKYGIKPRFIKYASV